MTGNQLVRARRYIGIVRLIQVYGARGCSERVHSGYLTICSMARFSSNLTARKNGSADRWRERKIDFLFFFLIFFNLNP